MGNDYRRVRQGDRINISARAWNHVLEGLATKPDFSGTPPLDASTNFRVTVRNDSGGNVGIYGVLGITGCVIAPTGAAGGQLATMPVLIGVTPTADTKGNFAICLEPIDSTKYGLAALDGLVPVKLDVGDASHKFATPKAGSTTEMKSAASGEAVIVWKESGTGTGKWAYVRFGASGSRNLRVGKYMPTGTTGAWLPQTLAEVAIYEAGTPPSETTSSETITGVVNHSVRVPHGSWVLVESAVNGYTYLVEAGTTGTCKVELGGDDLTLIDGYNENAIQVLGHTKLYPSGPSGATGCVTLQWYTVTGCAGV